MEQLYHINYKYYNVNVMVEEVDNQNVICMTTRKRSSIFRTQGIQPRMTNDEVVHIMQVMTEAVEDMLYMNVKNEDTAEHIRIKLSYLIQHMLFTNRYEKEKEEEEHNDKC